MADNDRSFKNLATIDPVFRGKMNGGNWVDLTATGATVDLPIIHELGVETFTSLSAYQNDGLFWNIDEYSSDGTGTYFGQIRVSNSAADNTPISVTFTVENLVGQTTIKEYYDGANYIPFDTPVAIASNGEITLTALNRLASGYAMLRPYTDTVWSFNMTNVSVKEITMPTESYNTYLDYATMTHKQLSSSGDVGEELVVNGDFTNNIDGWYINGDSTIVFDSGRLLCMINGSAGGLRSDNIEQVVGEPHRVEMTIESGTYTGPLIVGFNASTIVGSTVFVDIVAGQTINFSEVLTGYSTLRGVYVTRNTASTGTILVDDVTAKPIINQLSVSTTYTMTDTFQNYISHNAPLSQADLDALDTNPNLMGQVWFNGYVLPSGFAKADIVNFPDSSAGLRCGKYLQDLSVDLGAELITNGGFEVDASSWSSYGSGSVVSSGEQGLVTGGGSVSGVSQLFTVTQGKFYVVSGEIQNIDSTVVPAIVCSNFLPNLYYSNATTDLVSFSGIHYMSDATARIYLRVDELDATALFDNISIREATAYEIQNYTDEVRTNLENTQKGASTLLLRQDDSGRPTAVMPSGSIAVDSGGKNVSTGWIVAGDRYSIKQKISGELQDFGVEEYIGGSIDNTTNTGVPITDGFNLSGVGESRFYVRGVPVSNGEVLWSFDASIKSGNLTIHRVFVSGLWVDIPNINIINGANNHVIPSAISGGDLIIADASGDYDIDFIKTSIKELTTKTQRTETRTLTHDATVLGDEIVTNGTFDTTDDWTSTNAIISAVNNELVVEDNGIYSFANYSFSTIKDKIYKIVFSVRNPENTGQYIWGISVSTAASLPTEYYNSGDTSLIKKEIVYFYTAGITDASMFLRLGQFGQDTGDISYFSNVSIQEVLPDEDLLYIDTILQDETPSLPTGVLTANNTASIGYPDEIDTHYDSLEVHSVIIAP